VTHTSKTANNHKQVFLPIITSPKCQCAAYDFFCFRCISNRIFSSSQTHFLSILEVRLLIIVLEYLKATHFNLFSRTNTRQKNGGVPNPRWELESEAWHCIDVHCLSVCCLVNVATGTRYQECPPRM